MGGSAEYREGKKIEGQSRNAIDEFLYEHSFRGRGGVAEGFAYEYISAVAAATLALDHDMMVTVNRTARLEYEGTDKGSGTQIVDKYTDMRKALNKLRGHPKMLRQLLSEYGVTIQNYNIQNGVMDLTYSYTDRNGKVVTQTTQFDSEISRFPGLGVRW